MFNLKRNFFAVLSVFLLLFILFYPRSVLADEKKIVITLSQEHLTAYEGNTVFLDTPVTTGGPQTQTLVGTYKVLSKLKNFVLHSP